MLHRSNARFILRRARNAVPGRRRHDVTRLNDRETGISAHRAVDKPNRSKPTTKPCDREPGCRRAAPSLIRDDDENGLVARTRLPRVFGGGLIAGKTYDYAIELIPGEYRYSCPLNPTPDYRLVVAE